MAQFDVYPNPSRTTKKYIMYLLDIQNDFLSKLATRIAISLKGKSSFNNEAMTRLTPEVSYGGESGRCFRPLSPVEYHSNSRIARIWQYGVPDPDQKRAESFQT